MGNYFDLIAAINAAIKTNGEQGITGASLNAILRDMVAALGAGYQYVGVVAPDAAAPSTDYNAVYLGLTAGTYTNFGGTQVRGGQFGVFTFNGSWTYNVADIASGGYVRYDVPQVMTQEQAAQARSNIAAASNADVSQLGQEVDKKAVEILSKLYSLSGKTKQRGLFITDESGNIAWHLKPYVTEEGGTYFIDDDGNIGVSIKDGKIEFCKLGSNTIKQIREGVESGQPYNKVVTKNKDISDSLNKPIFNIEGLLALNDNADTIKTVTITNSTAKKKAVVHFFLHTRASHLTENSEDVFFNGNCKYDFSDVRFYNNGKPCKAQFGKLFNGEIVSDSNLGNIVGFLSTGVGFGTDASGLFIATNNLATRTHVPGTGDGFTNHASAVYGRTKLWPLQVVDANDNIFAYAGGKLYRVNASTSYTTWDEICDFSQVVDGNTIYPDIQPHGMDIDADGKIYFGPYQDEFLGLLYVSDNNGENFSLKYNKDKGCEQHIHHIHYSADEGRMYASFDCNQVVAGPVTIYTEDGGNTWVHLEERFIEFRGRDYWPTYIGKSFKLGSGESNINGDAMVLRTETINGEDVNMRVVVPGNGNGMFAGFDDKNVFCGNRRNKGCYANALLYSTDFGKTFERIWTNLYYPDNTSGQGFRQNSKHPVLISGDTEQCLVFGLNEPVNKRVYLGGDDYCREVFVEVDDVPASDIVITVKNKHLFEYPFEDVFGHSQVPAWRLPLNEGVGKVITDGFNDYPISGELVWFDKECVSRYGEFTMKNYHKTDTLTSAVKLLGGSFINTGKHPELDRNKNFTITFWLNGDRSRFRTSMPEDVYSESFTTNDYYTEFLKWGNTSLWVKGLNIGIKNGSQVAMAYPIDGMNLLVSSLFYFVAITVGETPSDIHISMNAIKDTTTGNASLVIDNIGKNELIICNEHNDSDGMFISDVCIYDKVLSFAEIQEIYNGFNV